MGKACIHYSGFGHMLKRIASILFKGCFWPRKRLENIGARSVVQLFSSGNVSIRLMASGRSCLKLLFQTANADTLILPDYICNVVDKAAENLNIRYYHINELLKFDITEILCLLDDTSKKYCILIPAYLNRDIDQKHIVSIIRNTKADTRIIFDECQNALACREISEEDEVFTVVSFNNKMTYGLLGGAIAGNHRNMEKIQEAIIESVSLKEDIIASLAFARFAMKDFCHSVRCVFPAPKEYEKSNCTGIYAVKEKKAYKISLAAMIDSIRNTGEDCEHLKKNRDYIFENADRFGIKIIPGISEGQMPYVPIEENISAVERIPLKGPYSCANYPEGRKDSWCVVLSALLYFRR